MASIFKDTQWSANQGLNVFFKELSATALTSATSKATALFVGRLSGEANKLFLNNQTDAKIYVAFFHPLTPRAELADTSKISNLISIHPTQTFAVESIAPPHMFIPAGTYIYVYGATAPANGEFSIWAYPG